MRKRSPGTDEDGAQPKGQHERQFITSLHRGLEVLRAFRPDDRAGLSNGDLAERTGLPNSTVSRLTYTLLTTGYLNYDAVTGRYRMGVPVLSLGYACLSSMPLRDTAQTYMQTLADSVGEGIMVALGSRDERTMTYFACARSRSVVALQLGVGSRISLARSAMGRAWLAGCAPAEREALMADLEANTQPRSQWPAIRAGIEDAVKQVEQQGYYANLGEWQTGVNSVGVPLRSPDPDLPLLGLNLGGPSHYLPADRLAEAGKRLVELAATLGQRMNANF
ncbi:MAG: IclR family transcriptional regulator [Pseudomonadota bacterium]|nr:IclR family transcriptional regulator [Pseudomonadota bacterium]